jgi:hypothetical protein
MDWSTVVPVAALVSAVVTLTIRFLDRPRPSISVEAQMVRSDATLRTWEKDQGERLGIVAIYNSGNGAAYEVEVHGDNCAAGFRRDPLAANTSERWVWRIPVLMPSDHTLVHVKAPASNDVTAALVIRWTRSPGRRLLRHLWRWKTEVRLGDIDGATFLPVAVQDPLPLPTRLRRWRRLQRYTELGRLTSGRKRGAPTASGGEVR